ncbi:MAG: CoA-binding protein [Thermodesulfobacteriota bacterium]
MSGTIVEQLDPIFKPKSLAVIGASNNTAKWGGRIISQILSSGYRGRIYPVNPKESRIAGLEAFEDVTKIPDPVDLAIFTVKAAQMPGVMEKCVRKGIKGGVIISADFAETGEEGKSLEQETTRIARSGGLRFVGPNGNGIWTSAVSLNAWSMPQPLPGALGFISQSGTFGGIATMTASVKGFGLSKFVSIGNQADLKIADYLDYLVQDEDTKVIAVYVEGMKEGRRFLESAARASRLKPVLIFKGGSTHLGSRATLSHTASIAGTDEIFDAACKQAGVIRVLEIEHLFILAEALITQPLPRGKRMAIIGSGGQGVALMDALGSLGLEAPEFSETDKKRIKKLLPPHAPLPKNPVDFAAGGSETMEEVRVAEMLASFEYIDGVITNVPTDRNHSRPTFFEQKKALLEAFDLFCQIPEKYHKPILTQRWFVSDEVTDILKRAGIPIFNSSSDCARAMSGLVKYAQIKNRP